MVICALFLAQVLRKGCSINEDPLAKGQRSDETCGEGESTLIRPIADVSSRLILSMLTCIADSRMNHY